MTKAEHVFIKLAQVNKLDPKNDENWAPSGGYSIKGYGKKFNFDPGSTSVDTLSYSNPSNYDFRIKGKRDGKDVAYRSTHQAHSIGTKVKTPREQRAAEVQKEEHVKTHGTKAEQMQRESEARKQKMEAESQARRERMEREAAERAKRFGFNKAGAVMAKLAKRTKIKNPDYDPTKPNTLKNTNPEYLYTPGYLPGGYKTNPDGPVPERPNPPMLDKIRRKLKPNRWSSTGARPKC